MAGRGRGAGRGLSFNVESLGIMPGEALPGPCLQPPPAYPLLEQHPAPLYYSNVSMNQLGYKMDFINHFSREVKKLNYPWEYFPYELRPGVKKRKASTTGEASAPSKATKQAPTITNIDQLLEHLEKNETTQVKVEVEEEKEQELEEEFEDTDEEMDDGTDYNQNYFDNGENYLDEDDDMDDGPIY